MNVFELTLTYDEILFFLTIMGSKTMNGLEEDPFAGLEEQEIGERLNSGEQSLINRGLLVIKDDKATLDDTLVALVGSSVVPDATFLLTRIGPDGINEPHYFNATSELLVEQSSPNPGVYRFDYIPDIEALGYRVQVLLEPLHVQSKATSKQEGSVDLPPSAISSLVEACQKGEKDQAARVLSDGGASPEFANAMAQDCTALPVWVGVVAWGLRQGKPEGSDSRLAFSGEEYCWLVETVEGNENVLRVKQTAGQVCEESFMGLADPLGDTWHPAD